MMNSQRPVSRILLAVVAATIASAAQATLLGDDEARKGVADLTVSQQQLSTRVDTLSGRADTLEKATSGLPTLVNQVDGLTQDLSQQRGKVDELSNKVNAQDKRAKDLYLDLDTRLKALEKAQAEQQAKAEQQTKEQQAKAAEVPSYDAALVAFNNGDYKGSLSQFQGFLTANPKDSKVPNAIYWMGMNQLALKDYLGARASSEDLIHHYPASTKLADAMLNLASAQTGLEDEVAAKATLKSLIAKFPESKAAALAKERLKKPH
jgi:tol-pal system protein YbgF